MKVIKFGGTSVGSGKGIKAILEIIKDIKAKEDFPVVVTSAMHGVTNLLTKMAEEAKLGQVDQSNLTHLEEIHFNFVKEFIEVKNQNPIYTQIKILLNELEDFLNGVSSLKELSLQSKDLILSYGERLSTYLISKIAEQHFPEVVFVNASDLIKTDNHFGNAKVIHELTNHLIVDLYQREKGKLLFVTGFVASNLEGRITTLGRGGSDYTASLLGAALNAEEIQIWTDVDGMLTADPRIVDKAFSLQEVSYTEAMELAYFGAKVIYPPTMIPAFMKKIPLVIKNTFNLAFEGTRIQDKVSPSAHNIKGISSINSVSILNISGGGIVGQTGFSGKLFSILAREEINIVLITQSSSEHSITFAVHPGDAEKAKNIIETEFELEIIAKKLLPPVIEEGSSILAIVGENMRKTPGMAGKLFHALGRNGINVRAIAQGSSEYNISVIIRQANLAKALNAVHDSFFVELKKTLHVFNVGTGSIGSTLLKQIAEQKEFLAKNNDLEIKVIGLTNSRKMLFNDEEGIDLQFWERDMMDAEVADMDKFVARMLEMNYSNSVFIDNSASPIPPKYYKQIFDANISIVACNKIANSASFENYKILKESARIHGVDFYYETNVGAGLPIVRTLKDLMTSGDRIICIEAILSGTISYIFNNFKGDVSFHDIVKNAQDLGYTEPDPRDDLSGKDFMRKMLILARDAGHDIEDYQVDLGAILPESCIKAASVPEFYEALKNEDAFFNQIKNQAEKENKVIRYIGKLENGQVKIQMELVDESHPFYNLSGSDNIISFTTERYKERPMVVKGPGAGKEVTAAGVFADLVNVATN